MIVCILSELVQDIFNQYQGTDYPGTALILNHHRRLGPLVLTTRVPDGNDHLSVHSVFTRETAAAKKSNMDS